MKTRRPKKPEGPTVTRGLFSPIVRRDFLKYGALSTASLLAPLGILTRSAKARAGGPIVYASSYGAKGDGTTDNTGPFTKAIAAAAAVGGTVMLDSGVYSVNASTLTLTGNVSFDLNGATISQTGPGILFECNPSNYDAAGGGLTSPAYQLDIPAGDPTETNFIYFTKPSDAGNFANGDYIFIHWGQNPYDPTQPYAASINRVVSSDPTAGYVALEFVIPHDWAAVAFENTLPAPYQSPTPMAQLLTSPWVGSIQNGTLQQEAGAEAAIYANYAFNYVAPTNPIVNVQDITTVNSGVSVVVATCKGLIIENVTSNNASAPTTNKTLLPNGFRGQTANLWSSELIQLSNLVNTDVNGNALVPGTNNPSGAGTPILVESQCRTVTINGCHFVGAVANGALANTVAAGISVQGQSQVALLDNTLESFNVCVLIDQGSSFIALPSNPATATPAGNTVIASLPAQTQHPLDGLSTVSPWLGNTVVDSKGASRLMSQLATVPIPNAVISESTGTIFSPAASTLEAAQDGILAGLSWKLTAPVTAGSLRVRLYVGSAYSTVYTVANGTTSGSASIDFTVDWVNNIVFNAGDAISVEVITSGVAPVDSVDISFTATLCYVT